MDLEVKTFPTFVSFENRQCVLISFSRHAPQWVSISEEDVLKWGLWCWHVDWLGTWPAWGSMHLWHRGQVTKPSFGLAKHKFHREMTDDVLKQTWTEKKMNVIPNSTGGLKNVATMARVGNTWWIFLWWRSKYPQLPWSVASTKPWNCKFIDVAPIFSCFSMCVTPWFLIERFLRFPQAAPSLKYGKPQPGGGRFKGCKLRWLR